MTDAFADAVIVAAGASARMAGADKLSADIVGRPLLAWSVEAMAAASSVRHVIVVTAPERFESLRSASWLHALGASIVVGGNTRSASVLAGLRATDADVVLVHDGARPMATPALADAVARVAADRGAAVPVLPVTDSLKRIDGDELAESVDRDALVGAQTPQAARRGLLLDAFESAAGRSYSDEAGLLEAAGVPVATVPGEASNLKVTRTEDLELVRAVAAARTGGRDVRTGQGRDGHQFGRLDGLWLGGTLIPEAPRLHGHSDGDVVLHALATALLSAAGLGDLGRLFPAGDRRTAGAASADLLREVVDRVRDAGWRPVSVQIALIGARPRLGGARLEAMRHRLAELAGIEAARVSVTASTGNLVGAEGSGLAISATALAEVVRA